MGFTITSVITLPGVRLTAQNLYVSIAGSYSVRKVGSSASPVYIISAPYTVCTTKGAQTLTKGVAMVSVAVVPGDIYGALYTELKAQFPSASFVDN
jgi:hypothetical protein